MTGHLAEMRDPAPRNTLAGRGGRLRVSLQAEHYLMTEPPMAGLHKDDPVPPRSSSTNAFAHHGNRLRRRQALRAELRVPARPFAFRRSARPRPRPGSPAAGQARCRDPARRAGGNYAIRPVFSDGHDSGLYSWDYLYDLGERRDELWQTYCCASRPKAAVAIRPPCRPPAPKAGGCGHHH